MAFPTPSYGQHPPTGKEAFPEAVERLWHDVSLYRVTFHATAGDFVKFDLWAMADKKLLRESISYFKSEPDKQAIQVVSMMYVDSHVWLAASRGHNGEILAVDNLSYLVRDPDVFRVFGSPFQGVYSGLTIQCLLTKKRPTFARFEDHMAALKPIVTDPFPYEKNLQHSMGTHDHPDVAALLALTPFVAMDASNYQITTLEVKPPNSLSVRMTDGFDEIVISDSEPETSHITILPSLRDVDTDSTFTVRMRTRLTPASKTAHITIERLAAMPYDESPLAGLGDLTLLLKKGATISNKIDGSTFEWTEPEDPSVASSPIPYSLTGLLFPEFAPEILKARLPE